MPIRLKTEKEISTLREGGKRLAYVRETLIDMLRPGISTEEINRKGHTLITERGDTPAFLNYTPSGAPRAYPASICVSVNEEIVHGISNENPIIIKEGDIVTIDLGVVHEGLITDSARTVGVGEISSEAKKLIQATKDALYAGIEKAVPGGHIGDISSVIESVASENRVSIFKELVGHGVGYEVHEEPYVPNVGVAGSGEELVPGLVIAIEPMFGLGSSNIKLLRDGYTYVTKDGSLSSHDEHTIAITENGPEILTLL